MYNLFTCFIVTLLFLPTSFLAAAEITEPKHTSVRADPNPDPDPSKMSKNSSLVDNLSGTFSLGSNYIFRGLTQTENLPTAQGGFTYTLPVGLYVTLWGANNKFFETDINMEMDPGIGFYKEITQDFNIDISFYRYIFPSDRIWNYNEWLGQINYKFLQMNTGYSSNVYNSKKTGFYIDGGINYTLPAQYFFNIEGVTVNALLGHYRLPDLPDFLSLSYTTYTVGLSKALKNYNLALQYSNTNQKEFYGHYGGSHLFITLTANFS